MQVVLMANGDFEKNPLSLKLIQESDLVIAIDGGIRHLDALGTCPQVWLGDMDSYEGSLMNASWLKTMEVLKFPVDKDASDTELALNLAWDRGASHVIFMAMLGGRLDHQLFNLALLEKCHQMGLKGRIYSQDQVVYLLTDTLVLKAHVNQTLSVVPITPLIGLTLKGVKYPLYKHGVDRASSLCLSNVCLESEVVISLDSGLAYVILNLKK